MTESELKAAFQNNPKRIGAVSGALMLTALLVVAHRTYLAHANGIALWKGVMAGSVLGTIALGAAFRIHRRERWAYWLLLAAAIVVFAFSALHTLAEVSRAVSGQRIDYLALAMTMGFALLSFMIATNLLHRESREFFKGQAPGGRN